MAPTLYMIAGSPAVRSVLLCAKALEMELDLKEVDLFTGEHLKPEYLKLNPQHTVPTLVDDDGFALWDSHAIMGFLVGKSGDESLYPTDLNKRAVIDQMLHFDSSNLSAKGLAICKSILYGGATEVTSEQLEKLAEVFDLVENFLQDQDYIAGDELSIADFCVVTSVTSWTRFLPIDDSSYPKISDWLKRMEELPYYEEANKVGLVQFFAAFDGKIA